MKITKKTNIVTAASLKIKSENAITAFRSLVNGLKSANEEAAAAKAANSEQISKLTIENAELDMIAAQNEKIVQNIENLLTV